MRIRRFTTPIQSLIDQLSNSSSQAFKNIRFKRYFLDGKHPDEIAESDREKYIQFLEQIVEKSGFFDPSYYLSNNKDVERAGVDPLRHFIQYGGKEGREPSRAFDSSFYLYKNPEIKSLGASPLLHYIARATKNATVFKKEDYSLSTRLKHVDAFDQLLIKESKKYNNVIVMDSMPWDDFLQQRPHHLARLFAESGILIIYIGDNTRALPTKLADNLYLVHDSRYLELISKSQIANKYMWLFSTMPVELTSLKKALSSGYKLIYDYIDDFHETISGDISNQHEIFNSLESLHPQILVASAKALYDQLQAKFPKQKVLFCPNAVDINHFNYHLISNDPKKPNDLKKIIDSKKPIVGYYGAIAPWLDYGLINDLTKKRKDLNFVFIGLNYNKGLSQLRLRSNVHFLGPKDYGDLPQYSYWFSCAIIPFQKGDIAKATSPVKLFEYMSMGIPTICTRDLRECSGYEYVFMSQDNKGFERNIDKAIKAKSSSSVRQKLINQAKNNTWQARVDLISNQIFELAGRGKSK